MTTMPTYGPTFILLAGRQRLQSPESTNILGRVISHYQNPTFDYTPESPSQALPTFPQFLMEPKHDNAARYTAQSSQNNATFGRGLGFFSSSTISHDVTTITAPRITTRRLKSEKDYLAALKSIPDIRRKMLKMCPVNHKVYLVVGTMSVEAGHFETRSINSTNVSIGASVPLGLAASAAMAASVGVPLPSGVSEILPDVEAGVARGGADGWDARYTIGGDGEEQGEQVFAIACMVITRTWKSLGFDINVSLRNPEYRGAQHFGSGGEEGEEDQDQESDFDEEAEEIQAQGFELLDMGNVGANVETLFNPINF